MDRQAIYATTGLPAAGKSHIGKTLADCHGWPYINAGQTLRDQVEEMPTCDVGGPKEPEGTWDYVLALREEFGPQATFMANAGEITRAFIESNRIALCGLRNVSQRDWLETVFGVPVHIITVTADFETRLDRFMEREGYDIRGVAEYELRNRDRRERENGLDKLMRESLYKIENDSQTDNGTIEEKCMRLVGKHV